MTRSMVILVGGPSQWVPPLQPTLMGMCFTLRTKFLVLINTKIKQVSEVWYAPLLLRPSVWFWLLKQSVGSIHNWTQIGNITQTYNNLCFTWITPSSLRQSYTLAIQNSLPSCNGIVAIFVAYFPSTSSPVEPGTSIIAPTRTGQYQTTTNDICACSTWSTRRTRVIVECKCHFKLVKMSVSQNFLTFPTGFPSHGQAEPIQSEIPDWY